jgi:hypothetical protein
LLDGAIWNWQSGRWCFSVAELLAEVAGGKMLLACSANSVLAWLSFSLALVALFFAWWQIRIANSLRTAKLIDETYHAFLDKNANFYSQIRSGIYCKEKELNESLTLFDSVSYLQTQGLLHRWARAWEYIAAELQYFASNDSVCEYIEKRIKDGREGRVKLREIVIPFTGFPALIGNIPKRYQTEESYPYVDPKHKILRELVDREIKSSRSVCAMMRNVRDFFMSA